MQDDQIQKLPSRAERLLANNLQNGEKILFKLRGKSKQGLVLTDKHIYIPKWGFFGGRCMVFNYGNIIGIDIRKGMPSNLTVLSSATRDTSFMMNNAVLLKRSNYAITFHRRDFEIFQKAANLARELIYKHQNHIDPHNDSISLEKLVELKEKEVITNLNQPRKTSLKIYAWIFGIIFLITGIGSFSTSIISAILFIIIAAFLLPPVIDFIKKKWNITLSRNTRIVASVILLLLAGIVLPSSSDKTTTAPVATAQK